MVIGATALSVLLWAAVCGVAVGALYLLIVLAMDWKDRRLW